MKKKYRDIPEILKREIWLRLVGGMFFLVLFFIIQLQYKDVSFSFPCLFLGILLLVNGCWLLYCCIREDYLCVQGTCGQVETSGIRKRVKSVCIDTERKRVRVSVHRKTGRLARGNQVTLYLAKRTPVYEWDGSCMVGSYYALEAKERISEGDVEKGKK